MPGWPGYRRFGWNPAVAAASLLSLGWVESGQERALVTIKGGQPPPRCYQSRRIGGGLRFLVATLSRPRPEASAP